MGSSIPLLLSLLAIFGGIVLIPPIARRVGIPVVVAEIIFGIVLGVSFIDFIATDEPILDFFGSFGLVYLMFVAGLEIEFASVYKEGNLGKALLLTMASLSLPFAAGFGIGLVARVNPLLMGTIFCTTSLGIILPLSKEIATRPKFSKLLMSSVVLTDVISIFLLAFVLAEAQGSLGAELVYALLVVVALFFVPWILSSRFVRKRVQAEIAKEGYFDIEVRISFALIFLLAVVSRVLGFHAIIGAFIAGLIMSQVVQGVKLVKEKLQSFGYGFFIPLFFILVGAKVDLPLLFSNAHEIGILVLIVFAGLLSKVLGVTGVMRLIGFKGRESLAFGLFHCARLSLVIAAAEIALELALINDSLYSSIILLAIFSCTLAPALGKYVLERAA